MKRSAKLANKASHKIGARVAEVRKALAISQKDLADSTGFYPSYVSNVENGISLPNAGFLHSLATRYHANLNFIVLGSGDMFQKKQAGGEKGKFFPLIKTIEDLVWLSESADMFKHAVLAFAGSYVIEHRKVLEESIRLSEELDDKKRQ